MRKDFVGKVSTIDLAADDGRGGIGGHDDLFGYRITAFGKSIDHTSAVPSPALHDIQCGSHRRREHTATGRGDAEPPWGVVPR